PRMLRVVAVAPGAAPRNAPNRPPACGAVCAGRKGGSASCPIGSGALRGERAAMSKSTKPSKRAAHRFSPGAVEKRRKRYAQNDARFFDRVPALRRLRGDHLLQLERELGRLEQVLEVYGPLAVTPVEQDLARFLRFGIGACVRAVDEENAAGAAI